MITGYDSAGFILSMCIKMTLREKVNVKIAIFDKNLGVGAKIIRSGRADIIIYAHIFISLDS